MDANYRNIVPLDNKEDAIASNDAKDAEILVPSAKDNLIIEIDKKLKTPCAVALTL